MLVAAVLAAFGGATSASPAPGLPGAVVAPPDVVSVRMERMHGDHHHRMMRHHRQGHMMRHMHRHRRM
ncbi:hypothetical protein EU555_17180 [Methylobacterium nonmethylotrophicum]|uniref:Uncharacterized protein n=1 Tax=Methylobacterium nonmethylotrophicum TaxID=1141884 RepID=A0A4Z0NN86_9HYPH|nr:hypothetical protein EU555_17180 [Methylobacterium nonmethylotrophicum]